MRNRAIPVINATVVAITLILLEMRVFNIDIPIVVALAPIWMWIGVYSVYRISRNFQESVIENDLMDSVRNACDKMNGKTVYVKCSESGWMNMPVNEAMLTTQDDPVKSRLEVNLKGWIDPEDLLTTLTFVEGRRYNGN